MYTFYFYLGNQTVRVYPLNLNPIISFFVIQTPPPVSNFFRSSVVLVYFRYFHFLPLWMESQRE